MAKEIKVSGNFLIIEDTVSGKAIWRCAKSLVNFKEEATTFVLTTSRKIYPQLKSDSPSSVMDVNENYSGIAFRQFLNPASNPAGRINASWVEIGNDVYVYLDYNGSISDSIALPIEYNGRKVEVVEKNARVTLLSDTVVGGVKTITTADGSNYGFAVLKLTK